MSVLKKIWHIIMAIIQRWIITLPFYEKIKKKQEEVVRRALIKMVVGESLFKKDSNIFKSGELPKGLRPEAMPRHVAVILDGSRRWAKRKGLSSIQGYDAALTTLAHFLSSCHRWKIPIVSLFIFSSENWQRPKDEVNYLMEIFERALKHDLLRSTLKYEARVSVIGDKSCLSKSLQEAIEKIEEDTKDNADFHIIMGMSYSGQNDIVHACQSIAKKVKDGFLQPEEITKSLVEQNLQTQVTNAPSPDLLIRTSGELRVSNYYLWQSAYTEFYFSDKLWPDFGENDFAKALLSFQKRGRRFGRV